MGTLIDLTGKVFGKLVVVNRHGTYRSNATWLCKCSCGNEIIVNGQSLRCGATYSCGCYRKELHTSHGKTDTRLYRIWTNMKQRCLNKNYPEYDNYGGRGISICNEWKLSFESFMSWSLKNGYNDYLSIDRIDNNGSYEPDNCRWATNSMQQKNKRDCKCKYKNNERFSISKAAKESGINYHTVRSRIAMGWSLEKALTVPVRRSICNA